MNKDNHRLSLSFFDNTRTHLEEHTKQNIIFSLAFFEEHKVIV